MLEHYYNSYDENGRLKKDNVHAVEYRTTLHFLQKHLKGAVTVLDCCAGCGIYAFYFAGIGYEVTAGDLVGKHIDCINASEKRSLLKEVYRGNVLDMSRFADDSFDSVLCLGALYHLQAEKEREMCVKECVRVLKPKGIFAFAYINRNAIFINHFKQGKDLVLCENVMKTGNNGIFYGMAFGEASNLGSKFGIEKITDIGTDGLIYPLYDEINALDSDQFDNYMKYHIATCEEPSVIGHSMHGLWIGRKF